MIGTRELNKILIGKTNRGWYLTNGMAIHRGKVVTIKKKLGMCTVEILWEKNTPYEWKGYLVASWEVNVIALLSNTEATSHMWLYLNLC